MSRIEEDSVPFPHSRLFLLAAVHGDPAGYDRAWRLLEYVQPAIITVEISSFSVRYREQALKDWRRRLEAGLAGLPPGAAANLEVARVAAQTALPFEYRAARDWGRAHQAAVKLVDAGAPARRHLPRYSRELLAPENLRSLSETGTGGTLEDFVAREFHRARLAREGRLKRPLRQADEEVSRRERLWAKRLRRLAIPGRRVAHLGGWEHLVPWEDGGGLPGLLRDLHPRVILLEEADHLTSLEKSADSAFLSPEEGRPESGKAGE